MPRERQLTRGPGGRILTNTGVWSPDGRWVVYDTRSDAAGERFDGTRIEAVHADTGEVKLLYESRNGACCGVATWHPVEPKVAFILGPEHPSADWSYGPSRRQGVIVDTRTPGVAANLDARDLSPPFTPGALRGGSHVHVFAPAGDAVSFTYEDEVLVRRADGDGNQRNVGVGVPAGVVKAGRGHPRNHDGTYFCVLVTRTTADPRPGSDEISKAFEDAWVGGSRRIAFQGRVRTAAGETISEVFVAGLPADLRVPGDGPLQGTETRQPAPPKGTTQRRLTFTADRKHPGLQGPRHWLRSSPDGGRIGFLMKDDGGVPQLWTVPPAGGPPTQVTRLDAGVGSAFTWDRTGTKVAFVSGGRVAVVDVRTGTVTDLTEPGPADEAPRPEACVFAPDGRRVAFVRRIGGANQVCVADV